MLMLTATLLGLWVIYAISKDIDDDDDMGPGMMVPATSQPLGLTDISEQKYLL